MGGKQADRAAKKVATKADEQPAAAAGDGIVAAVKQLVMGSVIAEVMPMLPKLIKAEAKGDADAHPSAQEQTKEETNETKEEKEGAATDADKPKDAATVFEDLIARLPFTSALGLDSSPAEALALFTRLEVDFGPYKRKKGNAAMERIEVNVERNLSQYINIGLVLMCLNALVFRSWFACLPWLVGYQLLSLNLPMDLIRENFPQVPPVELKFRVAATMAIHALVWLFFFNELLFKTYFLAKFPLIGLFIAHAYVVVPEVNLDAARQAIAEKTAAEPKTAEPQTPGTANIGTIIAAVKLIVMSSFLVQLSSVVPDLIKELKAATAKKADEKKEDEAKSAGEPLMEKLSIYNVLGLGVPASKEEAVESWKTVKTLKVDLPQSKKAGAVQERIFTNFERNMPQYLHIALGLMCVRSFLFRSWFACLPWLVGYQMLVLSFDLIKAKFPQVPPVDSVFRVAAASVFHALVWVFFAYEATLMTHFMEKVLLAGLFVGHAYVMAPVSK